MTEFYSVLVFPLPDSGHWEELCNDYAVVGDSAIAIDSSSTIRCRAVSTYRSFGIPCDVYSGYYRRLDWIAPGIGMVYASHTVIGCPCDIPAHFVSKTIWRLLSYHIEAP